MPSCAGQDVQRWHVQSVPETSILRGRCCPVREVDQKTERMSTKATGKVFTPRFTPFHSTACAAPFLRYEGLVSFLFFVCCFHCAICLFSPACADALWSLFPLSQRKWSEEEKRRHSSACIAKDRLTLAQKIEIIRLHESEDYRERKSQTALASMFEVLTMTAITITRRRMNSKLQCVRLWHFIIPFVFTLQLA
jgi:hypothetical protein